ncbi:hypothetical protein F0L68_34655 [Solihabitans fulvus]|uniref:Uncharacterized protein n=1 Tax=Solihabitans fulvus TaxID=1892852 RepID=A0A5B2WKR1_9PSEU|nr:hypothetical protein [Solihabitans fulvus]KAA2252663.1 hypothetical protein F0L68_34655 [Solihabitans fulvus]
MGAEIVSSWVIATGNGHGDPLHVAVGVTDGAQVTVSVVRPEGEIAPFGMADLRCDEVPVMSVKAAEQLAHALRAAISVARGAARSMTVLAYPLGAPNVAAREVARS